MGADPFETQRRHLVTALRVHLSDAASEIGTGDFDDRVMNAMAKVPRHEFVPVEIQPAAYANVPLPIGYGKTISQPFIVAVMTSLLDVGPADSVLEIGTGLIEELARSAKRRLDRQGYGNIQIKVGNGYYGWPEHAPFDKMMVTAAPDLIPPPLIHQLKPGGRMVLPVGLPDAQRLIVADKDANGRLTIRELLQVRFSLLEDPDQPASRPS